MTATSLPTTAPTRPTLPALTPTERRVLEALALLIDDRGYPPTVRELGHAAGLASPGSVSHVLSRLTMKGHISRESGHARAITILQPPPPVTRRAEFVDAGVAALQRHGCTPDTATRLAGIVVDALVDELGPTT